MVDPATISLALTAVIAIVVTTATGKSIYKELYNSRFNSWGFRNIKYRPQDLGYKNLLKILQSEVVLNMSSSRSWVNEIETTANVVTCRVLGEPRTVKCRIGIQGDGLIYLIVWDPLIFNRRCGLNYYRKIIKETADGILPFVPIKTSLLVK